MSKRQGQCFPIYHLTLETGLILKMNRIMQIEPMKASKKTKDLLAKIQKGSPFKKNWEVCQKRQLIKESI